MTDASSQALKQAAGQFLQLVVAGRIDEAYRIHVDIRGKHHNPFFAAGFPALKKAMEEEYIQSPSKRLIVKNVLGDGDVVAVQSHLVRQPGDPGLSTVHLFRFHTGKIVEMWDCGQFIPADSPNADGAF